MAGRAGARLMTPECVIVAQAARLAESAVVPTFQRPRRLSELLISSGWSDWRRENDPTQSLALATAPWSWSQETDRSEAIVTPCYIVHSKWHTCRLAIPDFLEPCDTPPGGHGAAERGLTLVSTTSGVRTLGPAGVDARATACRGSTGPPASAIRPANTSRSRLTRRRGTATAGPAA